MHGHRHAMAVPGAAASVGGRVGSYGVGSGLGNLPNGAVSLHESFIYGGGAGGGWQGVANYAVVAPHHRPVCRYSSYPGKAAASGSGNYEDVWACKTVAAAAAAAAAASSAAAGTAAVHAGSSSGAAQPLYSVGGHAMLSRSKTWSPPEEDCRPAVLAMSVATDETISISDLSESSGSSSGCGGGMPPSTTTRRAPMTAAEAHDTSVGFPDRDTQHSPHTAPPKLPPVSGILSPITEKGVLRPVACRPTPAVRQNEYLAAPPKQTHPAQVPTAADGKASCNSDEGYWSRETSRSSCTSAPAAPRPGGGGAGGLAGATATSGPPTSPNGDAGSSDPPSPASRSPSAYGVVMAGGGASPLGEQHQQRPTAAARDLELMLRDREAEIESLRETLERNERAIFATFDERQASWQKQMRDLTAEYQRRLGVQQERAAKGEAGLVSQLQRAQQEIDGLRDELRQCRTRADDAERRVLLLLRSGGSTAAAAADHDPAAAALCRLKADEASAPAVVGSFRAEADDKAGALKKSSYKDDGKPTPPPAGGSAVSAAADESARAESERLRAELERRNFELKALRDGIETERQLWQQEKDKVIQYQKQLQMNYVQMYRKNAQLESELARVLGAESAAAALQQQPTPRRDCVTAGRGTGAGPALMLSFADNPESLC